MQRLSNKEPSWTVRLMLGMLELSDNISTTCCLSYANTSVNVRDADTGMDGDDADGVHDGGVDGDDNGNGDKDGDDASDVVDDDKGEDKDDDDDGDLIMMMEKSVLCFSHFFLPRSHDSIPVTPSGCQGQ